MSLRGNNVIGVRREDKNKWERRVPLTPDDVATLVSKGIKVIVQPSNHRIFSNQAYEEAGALLGEDLTPASTILAVKEVPIPLLIPERTYVFFSHTIKAQQDNMPLLDKMLELNIRQMDYECIREDGDRSKPRLVAFGRYAGIAGMIDFCRGLGERFLAKGYSTPFLAVGSTYMYLSLDHARAAIKAVGEEIARYGLPEDLCPFTAVFTGSGNVSKGAQEIFSLLPFKKVSPFELEDVVKNARGRDKTHVLYMAEASAEHMVRRKGEGAGAAMGEGFDKRHYFATPEEYEPIFHERVVPFSSILVNCMYWDNKFPRLLSNAQTKELVRNKRWRMEGVCEITCDHEGSIEFLKEFTTIEEPFYILNPSNMEIKREMEAEGILFHAVDHLPSECPREASSHFSTHLMPFLEALASSDGTVPFEEQTDVPIELRNATICSNGKLTPNFTYISKLRRVSERADLGRSALKRQRNESFLALRLQGHLFDSGFINKALDMIETSSASAQILNFTVGKDRFTPTECVLQLFAPNPKSLDGIVKKLTSAASTSGMGVALSGSADEDRFAIPRIPRRAPKRILLLGAGFVTGPVVEYLLRRPNNTITCASFIFDEAKKLAEGKPRVTPIQLNVMEDADKLSAAVFNHDIVISLVPAFMHLPVAKAGLEHGRHVVTASYNKPEIMELHAEAQDKDVTILMEAGLDPGIDHLSACKMIEEAKREGYTIESFSSLCGGLPAPECSDNPLAYKFSWNPRGVLTAASNNAEYLKDGEKVRVDGVDLMKVAVPCRINPALDLEVIPNRESIPYAAKYGIPDCPSIFRGTLRFNGFCRLLDTFKRLGLCVDEARPYLQADAPDFSRRELTRQLANCARGASDSEIINGVVRHVEAKGATPFTEVDHERLTECLTWLGMLSDTPVPKKGTPLGAFVDVLQGMDDMKFHPGERDMVVMHHELIVSKEGSRQKRTGTLVEYATESDSAMARTVGLTTAIAVQLLLDGEIKERGVQVPMSPTWYDPMLALLADENIALKEKTTDL